MQAHAVAHGRVGACRVAAHGQAKRRRLRRAERLWDADVRLCQCAQKPGWSPAFSKTEADECRLKSESPRVCSSQRLEGAYVSVSVGEGRRSRLPARPCRGCTTLSGCAWGLPREGQATLWVCYIQELQTHVCRGPKLVREALRSTLCQDGCAARCLSPTRGRTQHDHTATCFTSSMVALGRACSAFAPRGRAPKSTRCQCEARPLPQAQHGLRGAWACRWLQAPP